MNRAEIDTGRAHLLKAAKNLDSAIKAWMAGSDRSVGFWLMTAEEEVRRAAEIFDKVEDE